MHNGNQVKTVFGNWGVIGQPAAKGPRGAWKNPNNGYIGDVSPLIGAEITNGKSDIMLCSSSGKAIRFNETAVRSMGRNARGVRGIKLGDSESLISLIIPSDGYLLSASQNGYGKRTPMKDFPAKGRGGQGVIAIQTSERNGKMIGATQVFDGDEVMLISNSGTLVRISTEQILSSEEIRRV